MLENRGQVMRKRRDSAVSPDQKKLLTVEEAAQVMSLGLSLMQKLIKSGAVASVQIGTARRVPVRELDSYINRLLGA
jgi:excisionase family DNA binding protein